MSSHLISPDVISGHGITQLIPLFIYAALLSCAACEETTAAYQNARTDAVTGATGAAGPAGPKGDPGATGPAGAAGANGNGVLSESLAVGSATCANGGTKFTPLGPDGHPLANALASYACNGAPGAAGSSGTGTPSTIQVLSGQQDFAASGTFVAPSGIQFVIAEMWGGGGGRAFFSVNGAAPNVWGGGGAGYIRAVIAVIPGQRYDVVVGARGIDSCDSQTIQPGPGGDTTFDGVLAGGGGGAQITVTGFIIGGVGGTVTGGVFSFLGHPGGNPPVGGGPGVGGPSGLPGLPPSGHGAGAGSGGSCGHISTSQPGFVTILW